MAVKEKKVYAVHHEAHMRVWALVAIHRESYLELYLGETRDHEGTMLLRFAKRPMLSTLQECKDMRSLADLAYGDRYSFDLIHKCATV